MTQVVNLEKGLQDLLNTEKIASVTANWTNIVIEYGVRFLITLSMLIIGWMIINWIVKKINFALMKGSIDKAFTSFICSLISALLKVVLIISAASQIGIKTTSFVALLGAASLAVGLALQGSLSNFAGGILILIFRPFKVGDYIENSNIAGKVESIQVFHTRLKTSDNKVIIVPNSILSNGIVTNHYLEETRRVESEIAISHESELEKAKQLLLDLASEFEIMEDPKPVVYVIKLNNISVILSLRLWVKSSSHSETTFLLNEAIKAKFEANGINIQFPSIQLSSK